MTAPRWLPGVVTMPSSHDAGTMLGQDAYFTWHTYEAGYSLTATDGARRLIAAGNEVHFCFNPVSGGLVQILPADRAARGLVNLAGGVQTNRQGRVNLQVEVIAYAKRPWTKDITDVGRHTLAKLVDFADAHGIPRTHPNGDQGPLTSSGPFNRSVTGWNGRGGHFCHGQVPENCVTPDMLILTGDMRWIPAGELVTGDRLVGFDEEGARIGPGAGFAGTAGRRFREAFATVHGRVVKDCYRLTLVDGTQVTASADHKWLVNLPHVKHGPRIAWVATSELDSAKHRIKSLGVRPWFESVDKEAGWLAGAIDCDGSVVFNANGDSLVLFGQSESRRDVLDRFLEGIRSFKLDYYEISRSDRRAGYAGNSDFTDVRIKGGLWKMLSFLAQTGPSKFEHHRDNVWVNRVIGKTTTTSDIARVEHVGPTEVVSLESSTRTYVAQGLLCHNTHWDHGPVRVSDLWAIADSINNPPEGDELPLSDSDLDKIALRVWGYWNKTTSADGDTYKLLRDAAQAGGTGATAAEVADELARRLET